MDTQDRHFYSLVIFQKENTLQNRPMSSGDQGKLLIFSLLMVPSIVFLFGIIPAIFLGFGIYMMKKSQDFSYVDVAVRYFKIYAWLIFWLAMPLLLFFVTRLVLEGNVFVRYGSAGAKLGVFVELFFFIVAVSYIYIVAVQRLFHSPLHSQREWIEVNGFLYLRINLFL